MTKTCEATKANGKPCTTSDPGCTTYREAYGKVLCQTHTNQARRAEFKVAMAEGRAHQVIEGSVTRWEITPREAEIKTPSNRESVCPTCHAEPGQVCKYPSGYHYSKGHASRS